MSDARIVDREAIARIINPNAIEPYNGSDVYLGEMADQAEADAFARADQVITAISGALTKMWTEEERVLRWKVRKLEEANAGMGRRIDELEGQKVKRDRCPSCFYTDVGYSRLIERTCSDLWHARVRT